MVIPLRRFIVNQLVSLMELRSPTGQAGNFIDAYETRPDDRWRTETWTTVKEYWKPDAPVAIFTNTRGVDLRTHTMLTHARFVVPPSFRRYFIGYHTPMHFYFAEITDSGTNVYALTEETLDWSEYKQADGSHHIPVASVKKKSGKQTNLRYSNPSLTKAWWNTQYQEAKE